MSQPTLLPETSDLATRCAARGHKCEPRYQAGMLGQCTLGGE